MTKLIQKLKFKVVFLMILLPLFATTSFTQTNVKKVVLQGFWWDYVNDNFPGSWSNYLTELAPRLKEMGVDAVWIPPSMKNNDPTWVGYSPFDHYDLGDKYQKNHTNTGLGTKDELLRMIAVLHANGIEVIQDIVLNHVDRAGAGINGAGGQDPEPTYSMVTASGYKNFRYVSYETPVVDDDTDTEYLSRIGRFPKNASNFHPNQNWNQTSGEYEASYWGPDFSYGTDESNSNNGFGPSSNATCTGCFDPIQQSGYVRDQTRDWMMWLKKQTAVDGFRWDAVKHFPYWVVQDLSYNVKYTVPSWSQGGESMFNVGEFVGSTGELDSYVNSVTNSNGGNEELIGTFDFGLRAFNNGGLYSMVYDLGNFDMGLLPGLQQAERIQYYSGSDTYVHRTVPFVNNHDTFRPTLDAVGNYTGWNSGDELSSHIEPNEPRLPAAYAVILALDGNPQIFFEDLFEIGYSGNRFNHMPSNATQLPVREDLANLIWCHQNLNFKDGAYMVPFQSTDHLVIERSGKAVIGITDNWDTWQNHAVQTTFPDGTVLKDYSGANGTGTLTVANGGWVNINTPPVNPALNIAGRHGYSVWAPIGQDNNNVMPSRSPVTTQEWEMANDLGDSHCLSLGQGGRLPDNSCNLRIAGKIFAAGGSTVTYNLYRNDATNNDHLFIGVYDLYGNLLSSADGSAAISATFTPSTDDWLTIKIRNTFNANPGQVTFVNVEYTAPQTVNTSATPTSNRVSFWTNNGASCDWMDCRNWEEGMVPNNSSTVVIPQCVDQMPCIPSGFPLDQIVNSSEMTLSLDLLAFDGKIVKGEAHLKWQTGNEIDQKGFEVLRSKDGENFETIGFVNSRGDGDHGYEFIDKTFQEAAYYQLNLLPLDGGVVRSPMIYLEDNRVSNFAIVPNPTTDQFTLVRTGDIFSDEKISLSITNAQGTVLMQAYGKLDVLNTQMNDVMAGHSAGIYFIHFYNQGKNETVKLMKY